MNCGFRKIRAKVGNFLELRGICVKKSDDFQSNEAGQRPKRGKHFAKTVVLGKKDFAKTAVFAEINFEDLRIFAEINFEDLRIFEEKHFEEIKNVVSLQP